MRRAMRRARRKTRRRYLAVISLVKELGTGGGGGGEGGNGGDGGDGEDGDGENGGDGGEGPDVGEDWPPIGWQDPPGIFPPLTPDHPIAKLEEEDAPPAGAVWPHLPVKKGRFAALVDAGEHGYYVVALDASVRWPEEEDDEDEGGEAEAHKR